MKNIDDRFAELSRILIDMGIKPSDISIDAPFKDMGINSIDTMELILKIEEKFKISIPDKYLTAQVLSSPRTILKTILRPAKSGKRGKSQR